MTATDPKKTTMSKSEKHKHHWVVFSTALKQVCLMVQCVECGAYGTVDDPTAEEWKDGFFAPDHPYRWHDDARVTIKDESGDKFYVTLAP